MLPPGAMPRGGRNGGSRGCGNPGGARAVKRMRGPAYGGSPAASTSAAQATETEDGEIPLGPSDLANKPPAASYAQAAAKNAKADYTPHTHYSEGRDIAVPELFQEPPHLLITGVYHNSQSPPQRATVLPFL